MDKETKYLCIHCKAGFDHLPYYKPNECIMGYEHDFIKRSSILTREKREQLATAYILGKNIGSIFIHK
jgi:hypothetical protein